jgi:hypothetical protein
LTQMSCTTISKRYCVVRSEMRCFLLADFHALTLNWKNLTNPKLFGPETSMNM